VAGLQFAPATIDDLETIVELATAHDPDDPPDLELVRFSCLSPPAGEKIVRMLGMVDGAPVGYFAAGHGPWMDGDSRFGWIRPVLPSRNWTDDRFVQLVGASEDWQRSEGIEISVARVRERFAIELALCERLGYSEVRRHKNWELDLDSRRIELLARAERSRARMHDQGIELLTLDRVPSAIEKVYELATESERDIPTTVPLSLLPFEEWRRVWFGYPSNHEDRAWIAMRGDAVLGISMIGYPPSNRVPFTWHTGTARDARGLGIARALKYQTIAQAIAVGAHRIRTSNDGENAAILHLNSEMGYAPIDQVIELHRDLRSLPIGEPS
jgi:GNAT superfamily N-acetyltransferase